MNHVVLTVHVITGIKRAAVEEKCTLSENTDSEVENIGSLHQASIIERMTLPTLRASCFLLEIKQFRCYEAESEKAGSCRESNPGHPWLEPPALWH